MAHSRMPARLATIRAQTAVAASLVVAAALVLGGVLIVVVLRRTLIDNIDDAARRRAQDVAALVRQGALPSTLSATGEEAAIVQVVDARGRVLAATPNLEGRRPIVHLQALARDTDARTVTGLPIFDERDDYFRVVTVTVDVASGPVTVHVAESLERANESIGAVRTSLLVGLPFMLGLVGLTSWYIVGRALRPVDAIRREVADISASDLSRRVPQPGTDDEIGRLADTMNDMLDRLEAFADRQRRFVADASHELQSPLASSLADLELALADPDWQRWPETGAGVAADAQRMTKLVKDLLYLAQADDRAAAVPRTLIDLDDIVRSEAARLRVDDGLEVDLGGVGAAEVRGSADQLSRVVRNLLDNASHYAASRIEVELAADDGSVRMAIADDGPGVPPEARVRVFERFSRLDHSRSRTTGGAGLGLAIAREIVDRHGGSIDLESNGPGARFVVRLPAAG